MTREMSNARQKRGDIASFVFVIVLACAFFYINFNTIQRIGLTSAEIPVLKSIGPEVFMDFPGYADAVQSQGVIYPVIVSMCSSFLKGDNLILRFPALIFATLCIPFLYVLLLTLLPRGAAALSCLFLVLSPAFSLFATDGRGYSLFMFASIILYLSAISIVERRTIIKRILLFVSALVLFDASFFAFLANFAGLFFLVSYHKEGLTKNDEDAMVLRGAVGYFFYTAVAYVVVHIIYGGIFYSADVWPPPSSFIGSTFATKDWAMMTYIGSYAGFEKDNAFLGFAIAPLCIYGALLMRKYSRSSFTALFSTFTILFVIISAYFASGAKVTSYEMFTGQAGFAMTVFTPLIAVFAAASFYYLVYSLLSTSALAIYTPLKLIRTVVSVIFVLMFGVMFIGAAFKNMRTVTSYERENWKAAVSYLKNNGREGDVVNIFWKSDLAASYYLSPILYKNISKLGGDVEVDNPRTHEQTGSWIVFSSPPKNFMSASDYSIPLDIPLKYNSYEGSFGTVTLLGGDFPIVRDRVGLRVSYTEKQASKTIHLQGESTHSAFCTTGASCLIKLFLMKDGRYEFVFPDSPELKRIEENATICGVSARDLRNEIALTLYSGVFKKGYCEIILPETDDRKIRSFDIMVRNLESAGEPIFYRERLGGK